MSLDPFVQHRSLLFTVAYEMTSSVADAEDVVQDAWLRWDGLGASARAEVKNPRSYLIRVVTRQSLNCMRSLARQRETYFGEWLPEPLLTSPDVAEDAELAESLSIAMLAVLQTLMPAERAVFVLHEVFEVPYDEIAEAVDKSSAAVRQIAHRARAHVASRRPRMVVSRLEQQAVVDRFLAALKTGDVEGLMDVLAPDIVVVGDGGGLAPTAKHPISGRDQIAPLMLRFSLFVSAAPMVTLLLNGAVAARIDPTGEFDTAIAFAIEEGRITHLYAMRNPDKLRRLEHVTDLRR